MEYTEETTLIERVIHHVGGVIIAILYTPFYFIGFLIGTIICAIQDGFKNQFES